jgi:predicted PurR-regulated permease PerM
MAFNSCYIYLGIDMETKIDSTIVISSILAFVLISVAGIPLTTQFQNVLAQGQGGDANQTMQNISKSTNQPIQNISQTTANETGEAVPIQENVTDLGANITEGAKDVVGNIGEGLKNLTK